MVYKALNGLASEYISDVFTKVSESHVRNLRSDDNDLLLLLDQELVTMKIRSQYPQLWNELPLDIRSISTLNTFKNTLKAHLFKNQS